jgi:hypothetical protein
MISITKRHRENMKQRITSIELHVVFMNRRYKL